MSGRNNHFAGNRDNEQSKHPTQAFPEHHSERQATSFLTASPALIVLLAGLCWVGTLLLLFLFPLRYETGFFSPIRLLFLALTCSAGLLTFVPVQQRMELPYLAAEGIGGTVLFCYTLACVPPPNDWLLSPPELPVYVLLAVATFWSCSALVLPFIYAIRQRVVQQRAARRSTAEARRQAYGVGMLMASLVLFAGLRILSWISIGLLSLIFLAIEWLIQAHRLVFVLRKGEDTCKPPSQFSAQD